MNRGYRLGMALALGLIAVAWFLVNWILPQPPPVVAFAATLVDRSDDPILYGRTRRVLLKLENRGAGAVRLDAVQVSQAFANVTDDLILPVTIAPHSHATIPVEIHAQPPHWGQYEVAATARVSHRRMTQSVSTVILCELAAHLNPDPPLVQFERVPRSATIAPQTIRLWSVASESPEEDCQAESLDPAVRVSLQPLQTTSAGRRFQWELRVEIDARLAQPQHRSQIEVRTKGDRPPVIIPVVGYVDE